MIGIGLNDEKDITVKGLEAVKKCDSIYLESYTSLLQAKKTDLEKLYKKKIILADRELVEKKAEETILKDAKTKNTAFLVIGDVFAATTHIDLFMRAKKAGIKVALCGEMAGDPLCVFILVGLGIDELSMNAQSIPMIKKIIRSISMKEARADLEHIMQLETAQEVRKYILKRMKPLISELDKKGYYLKVS